MLSILVVNLENEKQVLNSFEFWNSYWKFVSWKGDRTKRAALSSRTRQCRLKSVSRKKSSKREKTRRKKNWQKKKPASHPER